MFLQNNILFDIVISQLAKMISSDVLLSKYVDYGSLILIKKTLAGPHDRVFGYIGFHGNQIIIGIDPVFVLYSDCINFDNPDILQRLVKCVELLTTVK